MPIDSIKIPSSVIKMEERAFQNSPVRYVELSEGLEEIGERDFLWCHNLKSITIPSTVNLIGDGAFMGSGLECLFVKNGTPIQIAPSTFEGVYDNCTLIVPSGSLDKYKNHEVWGLFKTIVEEGGYIVGDANNSGDVNVADITAWLAISMVRHQRTSMLRLRM